VIERSLDYHIRVSDKKNYVSPTRGQLGNALKCVWAAPFVMDGSHGLVEVTTRSLHHRIEVTLDRIAQKPLINHTASESVKNGTSVKVHWKGVASCETGFQQDFYRNMDFTAALTALVADYAAFNPHASFKVNGHDFVASDPAWKKWCSDSPTSAHWYRPADLRQLMAAYVNEGDRPVRDFVAEFAGLSGTQVRRAVLDEAQISGSLSDLVVDGDLDKAAIERLLAAMWQNSKPVDPARLGIIGKKHLEAVFTAAGAKGFKYHKSAAIDDDGLPCVLEVAFGVLEAGPRKLAIGLNWSPVFKVPSGAINSALNNCRVQSHDPVFLLIHQARPRFAFVDHGKGALADE
jgi:hypothetical protein